MLETDSDELGGAVPLETSWCQSDVTVAIDNSETRVQPQLVLAAVGDRQRGT